MLLRVSGRFNIEIKPPEMPENWKSTGIPAAGQPNATLLITKGNQVELSPMAQSHMKTPAFNVQPATKRIFAFGGSATLGVPVENTPPMTFPGQLSDMLSKVGLQNETLNLGGASFGSDHVKALSQEVKSLHPSAILIYSGNNEYFNFGLALSQKNPNYQSGQIYLQSLHLFRLFNVLLGKGPVKLNISLEQLKFEQDKRLAELIQGILTNEPESIIWDNGLAVRQDSITQTVITRYMDNLKSVLSDHPNKTVIIGEVPPNLFESPWLSLHHPSTSESERKAFSERIQSLSALPCEDSINGWQALVELDNWRADAWFGLGMCELEMGREYEVSLRNALELDMNPGRPTAALNASLHELNGANVIRFSAFDRSNSFGRHLFHDSCHLTPEGYGAIAEGFRNALIADGWAF